ncbi:MAG TPA: ATP-grasp domain-containing protein [Bacteroidota bacterium]|nr:ATP-grasp domain-containing protein [Bacteroidota bacterium]
MRKKITVAVIYNEPTVQTKAGRKFVSEAGILQEGSKLIINDAEVLTDLSEVGVLEEREDIARAIQQLGYKSLLFNVDGDITRFVSFLKDEQPDVIFNLCESVGNESIHEMHAVGIYELMGIPYTGSDPLTLGTALNKSRVKEILLYHGLPTPRFQVIRSPMKIVPDENLRYPLIVKPSREDASIGIDSNSIVNSAEELRKRVRYIFRQFDQPALVEEYIDGRELNVAIMGNKKPVAFPISEIDMSTLPKEFHRIISYNAKWMKGTVEYEHTRGICPAPLTPALEASIKEMALKAYQVIGCRDYARVDFRLSKDHQPFILEVNPNPDISDDAGFARSAKTFGYSFEDLIGKIIECTLERIS